VPADLLVQFMPTQAVVSHVQISVQSPEGLEARPLVFASEAWANADGKARLVFLADWAEPSRHCKKISLLKDLFNSYGLGILLQSFWQVFKNVQYDYLFNTTGTN